MVKKSVMDYIKTQLKNGYDISTIRSVMLRYGYTDKDIDSAINEIYHPTIRHEIHLSRTTVLAVVFIFASLLGAAWFFYYTPSKASTELLDLNLEPITTTVNPSENIVFLKELKNLGSSKRYDVVVKHEVIDTKTLKAITEKTETIAIETSSSTQTAILIPEDAEAGDYILRTIAEYDNKKDVATLPVRIIKAGENETKYNSNTLECNDGNPCTDDLIENGVCINKPTAPCCGDNICEEQEKEICITDCKKISEPLSISTETLEEIKEVAKVSPTKALQQCNKIEVPDLKDACIANIGEVQSDKNYCRQIANIRIKDLCYSNIAKLTNDNSLCEEISTDSRKDSCYMTFVLDNKDYSVCDKITNKHLRQSCESLRQLNVLSQQKN